MEVPAGLVGVALFLVLPRASEPTVWHVPSQCPTIQAGIDSASAGDTVLVVCGTYYEHDIVMKSGVCLRSETGAPECATLDADGQGRVFFCGGASDTVKVEGITVTGGWAAEGAGVYAKNSPLAVRNCVFSWNFSSGGAWSGLGGALYCDSCTVVLTDCVLSENVACSSERNAARGGAIYCLGSSLVLVECTLSDNLASGWYPDAGLGGGLYAAGSCLDLSDCAIARNAGVHGGGIYCESDCSTSLAGCTVSENSAYGYDVLDGYGGGLLVHGDVSSTTLLDCVLSNNTASRAGGGLLGAAQIEGCEFVNNVATEGAGVCGSGSIARCVFRGNSGYRGGAIKCGVPSSEIAYCTFFGNGGHGSAVYCARHCPRIERSILAFSTSGAAIKKFGSSGDFPHLSCCNLYGNKGGDWVGYIAHQYGLNGNFSADPLFCNADSGDFHLDVNSPCAPANAGACGLIGALETACGDLPPDLALGVFQNPYLTQYLDIYVASSEELDSASVIVRVASDTIAVRCLDDIEHIWMGDYELTGSGDSISIQACASDIRGNDTCVTTEFSATFIAAAVGGMATSPDRRLRLTISPGALNQDSFVLILPGETAQSNPPKEGSGFTGWHIPTAPDSGMELPSYRLSPDGILAGSQALLELSFAGMGLEGETLGRLYIEQQGSGLLESFVDPERQIVTASVSDLGTFRLGLGAEGSSRLVDPKFIRVDQNFPNPFTRSTMIRFEIRSRQQVRVSVYDVAGRFLAELLSRTLQPGSHQVVWDGTTERGGQAAAGIYFCRVQSERGAHVSKMLLVR